MTLRHVVDVRSVAEESAVCVFRVDLEVKAVCFSETLWDLTGYEEYDNTDANFVRPY